MLTCLCRKRNELNSKKKSGRGNFKLCLLILSKERLESKVRLNVAQKAFPNHLAKKEHFVSSLAVFASSILSELCFLRAVTTPLSLINVRCRKKTSHSGAHVPLTAWEEQKRDWLKCELFALKATRKRAIKRDIFLSLLQSIHLHPHTLSWEAIHLIKRKHNCKAGLSNNIAKSDFFLTNLDGF